MSVSVTREGPYFGSGSISFSSLRNTFKEVSSGTIKASELRRNTNPYESDPIMPDATENSAVSSSSNWKVSQVRNTYKRYKVTQSGSDQNLALENAGWNGNLSKNIQKFIYITGFCYSYSISTPAARLESSSVYNARFDISGQIYGAGGLGGQGTSSSTVTTPGSVNPYFFVKNSDNNGTDVYITSSGSGSGTILVTLEVNDNPSTDNTSFDRIKITSDGSTITHDFQEEHYTKDWTIPITAKGYYKISFDGLQKNLGYDPGDTGKNVTSIPTNTPVETSGLGMRDTDGDDCNSRIFLKPKSANGTTSTVAGTGGLSGENGGTALSLSYGTGSISPVYIRSSARIWGGGGGGERGKNYAGSPGTCTKTYSTSGCGSASCAPGDSVVSSSTGGCCEKVETCSGSGDKKNCTTSCVKNTVNLTCKNSFASTTPDTGFGGSGGNGEGYGQSRTNGSPGTTPANKCPTCPSGTTLSGGTCSQTGQTGGNGGSWGTAGDGTDASGTGGSAGYSIAGSYYRISGYINGTTLKGSYNG